MNQLQKKPQNTLISLVSSDGMKSQMMKALPKHLNADRMARVTLTALRNNPRLMQCSQESFLGALMQAAQLGLEPNTPLGQCYLIPYGSDCNFQVGYKGIIDLAYRTGRYEFIYAQEVYPNDRVEVSLGLEPNLIHIPAEEPEGEPNRFYAVYKLTNGGRAFRVWSRAKIVEHAKKYSKTFAKSGSAWQTSFDSMAKKTVLLDLLKTAPLSPEMADAMGSDDKLIKGRQEGKEIVLEHVLEQEEPMQIEDGTKQDDIEKMLQARKKKEPETHETAEEEKKIKTIRRTKKDEEKEDKINESEIPEVIEEAKKDEIYNTISSFKEHPVISGNPFIIEKLNELERRKLTIEDRPKIITAIRKCNSGDFSELDELLKNKPSF